MNLLLGSYNNGNYKVSIYDDGTKIRENDLDNLTPDTIESMDIKITNCCDMGCPFCHENSLPDGEHGDILSPSFLDNLHPFTELAIGGGNILEHPDLDEFLVKCKNRNHIASATINQRHFERDYDRVKRLVDERLIYGLGISLVDPSDKFIELVKTIPNAVIHVINGVVTKRDLIKLKDNDIKILILGYKEFRRGVDYKNNNSKSLIIRKSFLYDILPTIINEKWFKVISFDNLALDQLDVKRLLSEEEWNTFYMGDDGQYTMYVDMVNRVFAKNSCEPLNKRYPLYNTVEEMFNYLKEN